MSLRIIKAKPNPAGKDRIGSYTPPTQLAGEWIDIQNTGTAGINVSNVEINQIAYKADGTSEWRKVIVLSGVLPAGQVVRVHSGHPLSIAQMNAVDVAGANYHVFTEENYIWNNKRVDRPSLWDLVGKTWIDQTSYDAYPTEGKILTRIGDKLM